MRRSLVATIVVVLLVACSGGSSVDPEADEALIEDAILTLDDLPDGFVEGEADGDENNDAADECVEDASGVSAADIDDATTAETGSVEFNSGDGNVNITAEITAFESSSVPESVLETFGDDEVLDCLVGVAGDEGALDDLAIDEIDVPGAGGQPSAGVRVTGVLTEGDFAGVEVETQQHAVLVNDRFGVTVTMSGLAGELDEDLVADAMETMVERLQDA